MYGIQFDRPESRQINTDLADSIFFNFGDYLTTFVHYKRQNQKT